MVAFKPYSMCSIDEKPSGIPDEWPWQEQPCTQEQSTELEAKGFIVVSNGDYAMYKATYQAAYDSWKASVIVVPQSVTPRQIRLALVASGISMDYLDTFINNLSEPTRTTVKIWWEYSTLIERNTSILNQMTPLLGLTPTQVDNIFILASTL